LTPCLGVLAMPLLPHQNCRSCLSRRLKSQEDAQIAVSTRRAMAACALIRTSDITKASRDVLRWMCSLSSLVLPLWLQNGKIEVLFGLDWETFGRVENRKLSGFSDGRTPSVYYLSVDVSQSISD